MKLQIKIAKPLYYRKAMLLSHRQIDNITRITFIKATLLKTKHYMNR